MANITEMLKQSGSVLLGLAIMAGFMLLFGAMFAGFTAISAFLYPIVSWLAGLSILVFLFIVLPLSFFQPLRSSMAITSMVLSYSCGAAVWLFSFLTVVFYLKWFALFLLFYFPAVSPIACIGLLFARQWAAAGGIVLGLIITYGMRIYAAWLGSIYETVEQKKYEIRATVNADSAGEVIAGSRICPSCYEKNNPDLLSCWKCGGTLQRQLGLDSNETTSR
ncbi:MAG: hypothetical protein ABH891_07160 [Candidatus Omnitrophota bacterium]